MHGMCTYASCASFLPLQLVRCNGSCLLPYKDILLRTLEPVLSLHSPQGFEIGGQVIRFLLRALCLTYPLEFRSITTDLDQPLSDYLPIRVSEK